MEGKPPILKVGKYAGLPIDKVPMSYLRWMLSKDFDKELVAWAKEKVMASVETSGINIDISRHAYDKYSLCFMDRWTNRATKKAGFGSFLALEAHKAYKEGKVIARPKRFADDVHTVSYDGIYWAFSGENSDIPTLVTVFS